ncbi:sugar ABC transporter substrate-binding protein [Actinocorallia herbida]|uniref:sugar ABC transporter substrate-binding protein n=1 Tax=Actinocorallia herbida TaxID=58109 RepID=UPI000F4BAACF|nr:substrate-binding domain-containing protein [Actinocorallia herbida]
MLAVAVCAMASVLAACGSGGADGGDADGVAATVPAQVRTDVDALRRDPVPIALPKLEKSPPSGKSVIWLGCKYPECATVTSGIEPAAEALGWKLTTLRPEVTPEAILAAWTQAVAAKPDVILAIDVLPIQAIAEQLDDAEKAGIRVILTAGPTKPGEHGVDASIGSVAFRKANATAMTEYAIADSGGKAHILLAFDPSIPLQLSVRDAAKEAAATCPGCSFAELEVQLAQAGKTIPGQVISHIQRHPDVDYVITTGSGALGVAQALKSAGLGKVHLVTSNAQLQDLAEVKKGLQAAAIPNEEISVGWRMVDAAARLLSGAELPEDLADPVGQRQLFDKANIDEADLEHAWDVPDSRTAFLTAWGLG